jgi:hypothetical protein
MNLDRLNRSRPHRRPGSRRPCTWPTAGFSRASASTTSTPPPLCAPKNRRPLPAHTLDGQAPRRSASAGSQAAPRSMPCGRAASARNAWRYRDPRSRWRPRTGWTTRTLVELNPHYWGAAFADGGSWPSAPSTGAEADVVASPRCGPASCPRLSTDT